MSSRKSPAPTGHCTATSKTAPTASQAASDWLKVQSKPIEFRADAAQPYDQRNLSFALDARTISLWTVAGRLKDIPFTCPAETLKALAEYPRGESDLLYRDGMWLLIVTVDVPGAALNDRPRRMAGRRPGHRQHRHHQRRRAHVESALSTGTGAASSRCVSKLQAKQTKSAKRVLKRQRRKEQRRGS